MAPGCARRALVAGHVDVMTVATAAVHHRLDEPVRLLNPTRPLNVGTFTSESLLAESLSIATLHDPPSP
jgi:hypothetical protein